MPPRVVVLGAGGLLGHHLSLLHQQNPCLCTFFSRPAPGLVRLDLTDRESMRKAIKDFGPDLVYLPAAVTTPSFCQADPKLARAVNTAPAAFLADLSMELGFRLVFISSDLVFDGAKGDYREPDQVNPLSVYGRTKVEAESAVLERVGQGADCLVVRTSLILGSDRFGLTGNLAWMKGLIDKGERIPLFVDEFRNPSAASDLARALKALAEKGSPGLFHLAGPEKMSRYQLGEIVCRVMGWPESRLRPTRLAELDLDPPRPPDVSLNQEKAVALLGREMARPLAQTLARSI